MRTSHALLLRLFHDPRCDKNHVSVWYIDRGADNNKSHVVGSNIKELSNYYMEIVSGGGTKCIPYHRILAILYKDSVIWERYQYHSP